MDKVTKVWMAETLYNLLEQGYLDKVINDMLKIGKQKKRFSVNDKHRKIYKLGEVK